MPKPEDQCMRVRRENSEKTDTEEEQERESAIKYR